jgi:hypothetical protein
MQLFVKFGVCLCDRYVVDDQGCSKTISTSGNLANSHHLTTSPIESAALPGLSPTLASSIASVHAGKMRGKFRDGLRDGEGGALCCSQTLSRFQILHRDQHGGLRFIPGTTGSTVS